MKTTISSKGQLVVPAALRMKLRLRPGDTLSARLRGGSLVFTPELSAAPKLKFGVDRATGMFVVKGPPGAPRVTSAEIRALLADFP